MSRRRDQTAAERRAARLVRCYPRAWRARYGDEFTALLTDELSECPRSLRRTADVVRCGLMTRASGLVADGVEPLRQRRAALGTVGLALAAFLTVGVGVWSQLTVPWQWSPPRGAAPRTGMWLMSGAVLGLVVVCALALVPIAGALLRALRSFDPAARLAGPLLMCLVGGAVIVLGGHHFGHGWPGTGGHPWRGRGLVPSDVAAFCWAATLWVSAYWAHPGALATFPSGEIVWMVISPLALLTCVTGAAGIVSRVELGRRALRYEAGLALAATGVMGVFLAGAGSWILTGGSRLYAVGTIDLVALAVMTGLLLLTVPATRRCVGAAC